MLSPDPLPQKHLPGRSATKSAWGALITLLLLIALWVFHPVVLRMSVRSLFWATRPLTGVTIKARNLHVAFGEPLRWEKVTITQGQAPYQSEISLKTLSLTLTSPWRMIFGDHVLVDSITATEGKGIVDLRNEKNQNVQHILELPTKKIVTLIQKKIIPSTISLHDISLVVIAKDQRYSITNFQCLLSKKTSGKISYQAITIESGDVSCHLTKGSCEALWDGKIISLKNLPLAEEITLRDLQLLPQTDHLEFGLTFEIFQGIVRADGSITKNNQDFLLAGAILGQKISLDRFSKILGLTEKISGNLREGRLTFRGSPLHLIDADASLRLIADDFHWKKRGWAALSVVANLIGRKVSLTEFQLKQHENRMTASGEITLPPDWHKIAQAPFLLKLKATISDASELADLMGAPWNKVTGKLFIDGEVHGSENRADGYLNAQGNSMTAYGLPLDSLKLQMLFEGEKTILTNLDLWSGSDRLQLSGSMENSWPHHYEGKGSLNSSNLAEKLSLLEATQNNLIHGGNLTASWKGDGTATNHEGFFDVAFHQVTSGSEEINGHCNGSYKPDQLFCSIFSLQENSNRLNALLTLASQGITLSNIHFSGNNQSTLSGNIFLPINATALLHEENWTRALLLATPLNIHLVAQHLQLDENFPFFVSQLNERFNNEFEKVRSKIFPEALKIKQALVSGELSIQGLFYEPKFLGHLQLQAEELDLGTVLSPVKKAHAELLFTSEKIILSEATALMGTGKISASGSSEISFWKTLQHHYHISGEQLSLYQSPTKSALGNIDVSLQGNSNGGQAEGKVNLTKITCPTEFHATPFLIPPGIILSNDPITLIKSTTTDPTIPSWTTDISINNATEKTATLLGKSTLRLVGNLFSPSLEGSLLIRHLPLVFPQTKISSSEGYLNFTTDHPWQPELHLTANGFLHGEKINIQLLETGDHHSISFQNYSGKSPESIAMLLALSRDPDKATPGWIEEVPFWIRQEQLEQQPPANYLFLKNPMCQQSSTPTEIDGLGFSSHGISFY